MNLWEKIRSNTGLPKEHLERFVYSTNIDAEPFKPEEAMAWLALKHEPIRLKDRQGNDYTFYKEKSIDAALDALYKQMKKKPLPDNKYFGNGICPNCNAVFLDKLTNYCGNCGQKLDWGQEE